MDVNTILLLMNGALTAVNLVVTLFLACRCRIRFCSEKSCFDFQYIGENQHTSSSIRDASHSANSASSGCSSPVDDSIGEIVTSLSRS